jgi:hypothetical protein
MQVRFVLPLKDSSFTRKITNNSRKELLRVLRK